MVYSRVSPERAFSLPTGLKRWWKPVRLVYPRTRGRKWFLSLHIVLDLILVFKDGVVVEQGTHEELLQRGGLYSSMWIQQSSDSPSMDPLPGSTEGSSEKQASGTV